MQQPIEILERFWGFTNFKPQQEAIINSVLDNEDTFALLPTGGGKSLCYQIPALIKEGICIVISPLIALMNDQVNALKEKDIKAMAITSKYSYTEVDRMLDNCVHGAYKFLFLSPERLQQELVRERIKQMNVNLIAVDEAHCISEWGNDFRPAYTKIIELRNLLPAVNCIALTASATPKVQEDIIDKLELLDVKVYKSSFNRANLQYQIIEAEDKWYHIAQLINNTEGSAIVYLRNRKHTVTLSNQLEQKGISCTYYHGGLDASEKEEKLTLWKLDRIKTMVATNAFGMGIDKANVGLVVHASLPESIESYVQEAGRAGRNGNEAVAAIVMNKSDESILKNQFLGVLASVEFIKQVYRKLSSYFQIAFGEGEFTNHPFNFSSFCSTYNFNALITYNALQVLDRNSIISLTKNFKKVCEVQILCPSERLFQLYKHQKDQEKIIKIILRTYGGIFEHKVSVNTDLIARKCEVSENVVIKCLEDLNNKELIHLLLKNTDAEITFLVPREDDKVINRIANSIELQNKNKADKVAAVISYIKNTTTCKNKLLLAYFGESLENNCGKCSYCQKVHSKKNTRNSGELIESILQLLSENNLNSREIVNRLQADEKDVLTCLSKLLEVRKIEITNANTYRIL